ncbi:MAG: DNA (cytosine-5-)-methyltransferase [Richelia sp. SL_2_1]|nr:DNA (cytosine-5-)-methyltransferase [Richelia sp. SM1_7_0]NJN13400.1 DNA (cytosine-5-)-methyltransferase [Richelia sp. RM1_1_1]NJO31459.1 DNA (cytosine-5-)-methyltransferase [Richelia sp. SL_2_1]
MLGKRKLRQIDLCSGVGAGFPLWGIITRKVELCGLCETDEWCREILQQRFPDVPIYGDVRDLQLRKGEIDCITSSPPCQPFTVEGKRLAAADPRDCIPPVLRVVTTAQPKFFCLENVPGLLSAPRYPGDEPGTYFKQMLRQLQISGYDAQWIVVGTRFHFGTRWSGKRLLLIATSGSLKFEWERATPWEHQVRSQSQETGNYQEERSIQSRMVGTGVWTANRVDRSPGVPSGNPIIRARRAALGNILDPRIAAIAWERLLYLNGLVERG